MNSVRTRKTRRGVIGIESAIVMIAFVIVAAALAFVVLNMGFSTTQKSKTAVTSSIGEASSAIEIEGKAIGYGYVSSGVLNATIIPIKVAAGGSSINLDPNTASIKYYSNTVSYDNIYRGTNCILTSATYSNATFALNAAKTATCIDQDPVTASPGTISGLTATAPTSTTAAVYFTTSKSPINKILELGEHAVIAVAFKAGDRPAALDNLKVEVILPTGSALTVERMVPSITTNVVDLG